jgi:hypothetical protein
MGAQEIAAEKASARGPMGAGVHAWVPAKGAATIARPELFDPRRPTTTGFEKAPDVLEARPRDAALRSVWKNADIYDRIDALDKALRGLDLDAKEIGREEKKAEAWLAGGGEPSTTALWAVEEICRFAPKDVTGLEPAQAAVGTGCAQLAPYFTARQERLGTTATVEIVQPKAGLPNPPYSEQQYESVLNLYLRAAHQAGRFPEVTTHYFIDQTTKRASGRPVGDHVDPRCFNLTRFYRDIARFFGHAAGSIYGVAPLYGQKHGESTIWWSQGACHGKPPKEAA